MSKRNTRGGKDKPFFSNNSKSSKPKKHRSPAPKKRGSIKDLVIQAFEETHPRPMNYKQVSAHIGIASKEDAEKIEDILILEEQSGLLKQVSRGKYQLVEVKKSLTGVVDMTSSGSGYIVCEGSSKDVFVNENDMNGAMHGDTVVIALKDRPGRKSKDGKVVEILTRGRDEYVGTLSITDKGFAFLVADFKKMSTDIFIPESSINDAQDGHKVKVKITEWPREGKNPVGEVVKIFGPPGNNDTEMSSILEDRGFSEDFPAAVLEETEKIPLEIPSSEITNRRDMRAVLTFTIDPEDAKDFDDAISFQKLENGNIELGVHIADVSHYVKPGSELDKEAYERATSVYLVDRVVPMLPEKLSNGVCSLRPNEDKLCFSAIFELDADAQVKNEWFGKTIIHSDKRFAYEGAQEVLDGLESEYAEPLFAINKLAYKLRERKFDAGAISFESQEIKFRLDENKKPVGVYVKERKDAHKLIEDFMLLANRRVAEFIGKGAKDSKAKTFIYRSHESPNQEKIETFSQFAAKFGYKIQTSTPNQIQESLNKMMVDIEGTAYQNMLSTMAIRSMSKATYTTTLTSHYGLAFDFYTHFTSPIRRYPDVMVHRLLEHYLDKGKSVQAAEYEKFCKHCTEKEIEASRAERDSIKFKQAEFLSESIGEVFDGTISGLTEWGIFVEITENACEGLVRLRDMGDDHYFLLDDNCVIGQRKKKKFIFGDKVTIRVKAVDLGKRQVDFEFVDKEK
ncbi:MAG: ribonuclease R [Sphingobacteriales bacterium]|jgi:ribonuclease R